jgi:hypothetical protein
MPDQLNVDAVMYRLRNVVAEFDFTIPGADQSLGRDVANLIVGRIDDRCAVSYGPDSVPWQPNSEKEPPKGGYKGAKLRKYGWDETNRRTGQMLSILALKGRTTIEKDLITLRYGRDEAPSRGGSPSGVVTDGDKKRTDVQKAEYAHTGGRWGIKRPFYALGPGDKEAVVEFVQEKLDQYIASKK